MKKTISSLAGMKGYSTSATWTQHQSVSPAQMWTQHLSLPQMSAASVLRGASLSSGLGSVTVNTHSWPNAESKWDIYITCPPPKVQGSVEGSQGQEDLGKTLLHRTDSLQL